MIGAEQSEKNRSNESHGPKIPSPAQISPGTAFITGVQSYAGLGPEGNQFSGKFLRSATGNAVSLQLNNLPPHSALSLSFLFAAIDSLDGKGVFPQDDFFRVSLDGVTTFNESFANAEPAQIQTYLPPPHVELARRVDLGFGGPGGLSYAVALPRRKGIRGSQPECNIFSFSLKDPFSPSRGSLWRQGLP